MHRGVIDLTPPEVQYAYQLARASTQDVKNLLPRLESGIRAIQNQSEIKVQVTEDEVEILLDSLPMPNPAEGQIITSLRNKLSHFLSKIRFK